MARAELVPLSTEYFCLDEEHDDEVDASRLRLMFPVVALRRMLDTVLLAIGLMVMTFDQCARGEGLDPIRLIFRWAGRAL